MGINLGGRYVGVAQHGLQASQVGAAFQQVRGESVADDMRRQVVENPGLLAVPAQQLPESLPRHGAAAIGDEQVRAGPSFEQLRAAVAAR